MNNWLVEVVLEVGKVRGWSVPSVEERFYLRMATTQSSSDPFCIVCDQHGHVAMLCGQEKPIGGTSLALGDHLILNDISMDRPFSAYKNG